MGMEYSAKEFDTADKFLVEIFCFKILRTRHRFSQQYDAVYFTSY